MNVDVGKLTLDESKLLMKELIAALPSDAVAEVLNESLTTEQKEELGESWFNIDRELT